MEADLDDDDKFGGEMSFGECTANKTIKFVEVIDLDGSTLRIPFISYR